MKKSLLALAVLGAFAGAAFADPTVTLTGAVDMTFMSNTSNTANSGAGSSWTRLSSSNEGTSNVTLLGTDDIGGGLTGMFLYEGDFDAASSAGQNAGATATSSHVVGANGGQAYAGLQGAFGTIQLGDVNSPFIDQYSRTPFGTKVGSGGGNELGFAQVRDSQSMLYTSPTINGLTGKAYYVAKSGMQGTTYTGNGTTGNALPGASAYELGLNYVAGPLVVMFDSAQYYNHNANGLLANYTIGDATLMAGYQTDKKTGYVDTKSWNVAGKYALTGNMFLMANYAKVTDNLTNTTGKIETVGLRYNLSKRTDVYARYVKEIDDAGLKQGLSSTTVAAVNTNTAMLGLDVQF